MYCVLENVYCVAKPEPNPYEFDGRKGVSYKVEVSDGNSSIPFSCDNEEVYKIFKPFNRYVIKLDIQHRRNDRGSYISAKVIEAQMK